MNLNFTFVFRFSISQFSSFSKEKLWSPQFISYVVTGVLDDDSQLKRPRVICDNESVANWISQQINYARNVYEERQRTLLTDEFLED